MRPSQRIVAITGGLTTALVVNAVPWWLTRKAPGTDGFQTAGFPWAAYGRGGFSFHYFFDWQATLLDAAVAAAIAWGVYQLVQVGPRRCWRILRTWGTPLDESRSAAARDNDTTT